jgi:endonuclease/exonuclease/phosphatase family metal-dependent hydrolase
MRAALFALIGLLLACPAEAAELRLATWNLNWLTLRQAGDSALPRNVHPRTSADFAVLKAYARELDADVVAFQEVDGPEAAAQVFPADTYRIIMTGDDVIQHVGFAIRRTLHGTQNPDLTALDVSQGGFHLRSGADVTLDVVGVKLRLLAVHLKSGCQRERWTSPRLACEDLRAQVPALQGWIAERRREGVPFVLLGDFNRVMDGRDRMFAALQADTPLSRATEGRSSPCWGGDTFIDHIIAGGAARGWMDVASLRILEYREQDPVWKERLSDHCPVTVRIHLPTP